MRSGKMREFWDARADEDAFYFVDNRLAYRDPDLERFWASGREDLDVILDALGARIEPDDTVVEIGCGVGRITRELARRATKVMALDVSERMLELAREHNPQLENVEWIAGDGMSLAPLADSSADVCFSHVVFQHIPDPAVTLGYVREMGRVLRGGGWAAFQVSNAPQLHARRPLRVRAGQRLRAALGRAPRGQAHPAWLGSSVDLDRLRESTRRADSEVERVVGEGTQFCYLLLRKRDVAPGRDPDG